MGKKINIEAGEIFGRLTVVGPTPGRKSLFMCRCLCGHEKVVRSFELRHGIVRSCGCLRVENGRRLGAMWVSENREIVRSMLKDGLLSFSEIARRINSVTRERVRQLAKEVGIRGRARETERRKLREKEKNEAAKKLRQRYFNEWCTGGKCDSHAASIAVNKTLAIFGMKRCYACNSPVKLSDISGSSKKSNICRTCVPIMQTERRKERCNAKNVDSQRGCGQDCQEN